MDGFFYAKLKKIANGSKVVKEKRKEDEATVDDVTKSTKKGKTIKTAPKEKKDDSK